MKEDKPGMHQAASSQIFRNAKALRQNMTEAEKILWEALKNKQLEGFKFRRQHPLGTYIVDFYCHSAKLAIELDGGYHDTEEQREYDENRTALITQSGIKELRFDNEEVILNLDAVLEKIRKELPIT